MLNSLSFVVFFLAFTSSDDKFNIASTSEEAHWDELEAILFGASELADLFACGEELDITLCIGAESKIIEPELIVF